ncbi:TAR DNA-binding protein 43 [Armadillidium vulgare]|nr:TAR DNA-binding protein 43 [Armadillidium vulgare]
MAEIRRRRRRCKFYYNMLHEVSNHLHISDGGWNVVFSCVTPKHGRHQDNNNSFIEDKRYEDAFASLGKYKRKSDKLFECFSSKTKRLETFKKCSDLIILGLPWKTPKKGPREYFEPHDEVLRGQVENDPKTGQSKGFGFIRYASYEVQQRVLGQRHMTNGGVCDVKIPNSKEGAMQQVNSKIFTGRCTEDISVDAIKEYFSKYREITDVFIPKPFRAFAFVIFVDQVVAQSLCGEDYINKSTLKHSNICTEGESKSSIIILYLYSINSKSFDKTSKQLDAIFTKNIRVSLQNCSKDLQYQKFCILNNKKIKYLNPFTNCKPFSRSLTMVGKEIYTTGRHLHLERRGEAQATDSIALYGYVRCKPRDILIKVMIC